MEKIDLVILAGGKGTRIKNLLNNYPKPLLKFNKLFFLDYLIQSYSKYNIENIYILCGYKGYQIKKVYEKRTYNLKKIKIIIEKKILDTAGALYGIKKYIKNDFIITNGDSIFDIDLKDFTKKNLKKNLIRVALINNKFNKSNLKLNNLNILQNKKLIFDKKSKFMNSGLYYCSKYLLNFIKHKKLSMENDLVPYLISKKLIEGKLINTKYFIDIGTPYYYKKAASFLKKYFYKPAVFFDRDNTLIKDNGYTHKKNDLKFLKNVKKSIRYLNKNNYFVFIVTNQAGIAKGFFSEENFYNFQQEMFKQLIKSNSFINDIEYCPYHIKGKIKKYRKLSKLRKPNNKMITNLQQKWLINIKKSFMIGDQVSDMIAAKKNNLFFQFVKKDIFLQVKNLVKKNKISLIDT